MNRSGARHPAGGFTLVEVLVALVVMAVGLLGIAALYVEGLRAGRTSVYRTAAVNLAADMADRIRANPNVSADYAGTGPGEENFCVNGANDCTAAEMAADDWFHWLQDLGTRLPAGASASIEVAALAPLTQYNITVTWPEPGQAEPVSYTLALQL
jgi:type IV pilus assembly protein PilV